MGSWVQTVISLQRKPARERDRLLWQCDYKYITNFDPENNLKL